MPQEPVSEEKKARVRKPAPKDTPKNPGADPGSTGASLTHLQQQVGNRAVQRLISGGSKPGAVQRSGGTGGSFELDDDTAHRINQSRQGGQPLDSAVQKQMSSSMDFDFSGVRVHNTPEDDALNRQVGAKAFTTGQDVFFRSGAYQPGSSSGQELIAHELTHVVQQSTGSVGGGDRMTVNAPGDAYEQEADAVARTVSQPSNAASAASEPVQRQEEDDDELQMKVQRDPLTEEDDKLQMKVQRDPLTEEDDQLQ